MDMSMYNMSMYIVCTNVVMNVVLYWRGRGWRLATVWVPLIECLVYCAPPHATGCTNRSSARHALANAATLASVWL